MTTSYIGKPQSRVDGKLKVTGAAKYAAEHFADDLAYGYVVSSEIAKGKITAVKTEKALATKGVLHVFTHENRPSTAWRDKNYRDQIAPGGSPFRPLYDANIVYSGQPIALVVAEDFETARYAASLVEVEYERAEHETDLENVREKAFDAPKGKAGFTPPPKPKGDADAAWENAQHKTDFEYVTPIEHHNPMEMHASTVVYEDADKLTIYDKTQGVFNSQQYVCNIFGLKAENVRVMTPFMGGGFGSGLRPQYQLFLAVMAALELKRSVKLSLTREQMFTFGHRPHTIQRVALGGSKDGKLESLAHEALAETSQFENFTETVVNWSGVLYNAENAKFSYKLAQIDTYTPLDMRAPGAALGVFALESAMDELAYEMKIDPLKLRLKNYTEKDYAQDKPYSSKELKACYTQAAEKFGWSKRSPQPRSMRDGGELIGYGMATGVWDAMSMSATAKAVLTADGKLTVSSATCDIGTGTYTIMSQIAAETVGIDIKNVEFKLGDTTLPNSPIQGGSWTAGSVGTAVRDAAQGIADRLRFLAAEMDDSPFADAEREDVTFANGNLIHNRKDASIDIREILKLHKLDRIEEETKAIPNMIKQMQYSLHTHGACFVEVRVDEELGTIRVKRVVSGIAGGKILNPKTARSQILGSIVWGIGMALEEESVIDHKFGRYVNDSLAEYHLPVNADTPDIDVIFVEEHDEIINPLGVKGLGEIGIVGVAAAIANAVYHATGKRIRQLPVTLDKLL